MPRLYDKIFSEWRLALSSLSMKFVSKATDRVKGKFKQPCTGKGLVSFLYESEAPLKWKDC